MTTSNISHLAPKRQAKTALKLESTKGHLDSLIQNTFRKITGYNLPHFHADASAGEPFTASPSDGLMTEHSEVIDVTFTLESLEETFGLDAATSAFLRDLLKASLHLDKAAAALGTPAL